MHKIVTTDELKAIEKAADASGLTYDQMMQNAGKVIADTIEDFLQDVEGKRIAILVGTGNNGGDGLVAGYHLHEAGAQVSIYQVKERPSDDPNFSRLREKELPMTSQEDDARFRSLRELLGSAEVVIDAVLGTGFRLPLKGNAKELLSKSKSILKNRDSQPFVVAVDCPSGLDCNTGEIAEEALKADLTVTLAAAKHGLYRFPGASHVGKLVIGDIGIAASQKELSSVKVEVAEERELAEWLPKRPADAHKGTFGRVLIVAGSINYPGAAALAGEAAYRVGAGLVTMAVPAPIQSLIAPTIPEATWLLLPHEMGVISENALDVLASEVGNYKVMLIGPGFALEETTKIFLNGLFGIELHHQRGQIGFVHPERVQKKDTSVPACVIDADGLKLLSQLQGWYSHLPKESILTPHPGEMALMTGVSIKEIQEDRIKSAREWAKAWGHIVVLKGAYTIVAAPSGEATLIPIATPALARAGTGDVLAGAIVGFRAQGIAPYQAAILGCYVHGKAGEYAADFMGTTASVLAGDVADALSAVIYDLESLSA